MKKHKFKAWHNDEKRWIDLNGLVINWSAFENVGYPYMAYENGNIDGIPSNKITLIDYIGRTDQNGVEIYEGFIVEVDDSETGGLPHESKSGIYKVIYDDLDCAYTLVNPEETDGICFDECSKYTVIGNIYENPEPLNQTALNQ